MTDLVDPALKFDVIDIEGETYRTYMFPGFDEVTISGSVSLVLSKKDNIHRIWDGTKGYMIPPSWICLSWETAGNFVFGW